MTEKSKKQTKPSKGTFYSAGGIWLMVLVLILTSVLALWGLDHIGVIDLASIFGEKPISRPNAPAANIAGEPENNGIFEAIPREEYALALAEMSIPDEYYRNYRITIKSGEMSDMTEYYAVKKGDDWWVQTTQDDVILRTDVCVDGEVLITDNASNTSAKTNEQSDEHPSGVTFEERCGILTLDTLVNMLHSIASGEKVEYGGGIADYSLSITQSRTGGENLFSFNFVCQNGITEEYTFSFENAVILSASKSIDGNEIYKMELKDYRNDLSDIDTDSLFN